MTHSDRGQKQRCGVSGSEARPAVCPPRGPRSPAVQAQANVNTDPCWCPAASPASCWASHTPFSPALAPPPAITVLLGGLSP